MKYIYLELSDLIGPFEHMWYKYKIFFSPSVLGIRTLHYCTLHIKVSLK